MEGSENNDSLECIGEVAPVTDEPDLPPNDVTDGNVDDSNPTKAILRDEGILRSSSNNKSANKKHGDKPQTPRKQITWNLDGVELTQDESRIHE